MKIQIQELIGDMCAFSFGPKVGMILQDFHSAFSFLKQKPHHGEASTL
jgi:hypothetical protein